MYEMGQTKSCVKNKECLPKHEENTYAGNRQEIHCGRYVKNLDITTTICVTFVV